MSLFFPIRRNLLRFATVGVAAAFLYFVMAYVLVTLGLSPFRGSVLAYAFAFCFAYSAQRQWTFGGQHAHVRALPRYFVVQLACAALSGLVSHVAVSRLAMSPLPMAVLSTFAASAVSYVFSSLWVFPLRGQR